MTNKSRQRRKDLLHLLSQIVPLYPIGQKHRKSSALRSLRFMPALLASSKHVPLFRHGWAEHGFVITSSVKYNLNNLVALKHGSFEKLKKRFTVYRTLSPELHFTLYHPKILQLFFLSLSHRMESTSILKATQHMKSWLAQHITSTESVLRSVY